MAKKADKAQAAEIMRLRESGMTDAQIIAEHGSGKLAEGYRWLNANPGLDPRGEKTSAAPRDSRGFGCIARDMAPIA